MGQKLAESGWVIFFLVIPVLKIVLTFWIIFFQKVLEFFEQKHPLRLVCRDALAISENGADFS